MKRKIPLTLFLSLATIFTIACGDEMSAQEKEEIICGKMQLRYGVPCVPPGGGTTPTSTTTSTVTVTQTI